MRVDDQVEHVIRRARPVADTIRQLVESGHVTATLQMVRDFDAVDGEKEAHGDVRLPDGDTLATLPGQHQLLGWHIDTETVRFLAYVGAEIDCDE